MHVCGHVCTCVFANLFRYVVRAYVDAFTYVYLVKQLWRTLQGQEDLKLHINLNVVL